MVERKINPLPRSLFQKGESSSWQEENPFVPGVLPQTQAFLVDAVRTQAYLGLGAGERNLIGIYFGTDATLEKLKAIAKVTSRRGVGKLITSGMEKLWQNLPSNLQKQYPKEEVIQLKRGVSPETRARMSKARKLYWKRKKEKSS